MKHDLSPSQLFFLSFLYLFSGVVTAKADSLFALLIPFFAAVLWALIGISGAERKREDLSDFLSAYLPKRETGIPLCFFLAVTTTELIDTLLLAGKRLWERATFLPFFLIFGVTAGLALLMAKKGMTVLGRVGEMTLFLLIPLVAFHLFGDFTPVKLAGDAHFLRLFFSAMPAPLLFLMSCTAVSGDKGISDGFRATGTAPKKRSWFLARTVIAGAGAAVIFRVFTLLFPFGEAELLLYFLTLSAHILKAGLLMAFILQSLGIKGATGRAAAAVTALAGLTAFAVFAGRFISPESWMLLFLAVGAAVMGMLGFFGVFRKSAS